MKDIIEFRWDGFCWTYSHDGGKIGRGMFCVGTRELPNAASREANVILRANNSSQENLEIWSWKLDLNSNEIYLPVAKFLDALHATDNQMV